MINTKFLPTSINNDDDVRFLQQTEVLNMENIRLGVSEDGKNLQVRNISSTQLIFNVALPYNNYCIGQAKDYARQRIIFALWNDYNAHGWYAYDLTNSTIYTVLLSSQTEAGFNWSKYYRIDKNARIVGDLLLYTDNNNEPQCFNIEAGIKLNQPSYVTTTAAYLTPIPYTTLTLIKRPPIYQLQAAKLTDVGFTGNFIVNEAYQFAYRYITKYYQYSVISTYSQLMPYNSIDDTYNAINVTMPFGEDVPDEVQQVDFIVRRGNYGKSFVIRSFNKDNYYDAIAIASHNAEVTALGLTFYDNTEGIAIDTITANTSFDAVCLRCMSLEVARNRLMLANVLKGYNTPANSSLAISLGYYDTGGAGTYIAQWKYFNLTYQNNIFPYSTSTITFYYAYVSTLAETSYYYSAYAHDITPPGTLNAEDATAAWVTETELAAYVQRNTPPPANTHWVNGAYSFFYTGTDIDLIFTIDLSGLQFFKSSSIYKVSIVFYDRYRRKCGIVQKYVEQKIPDRTRNQTVFATNIGWTLSNFDALGEIPDWAYYYQIHIGLNSTTRFFFQITSTAADYVNKNQDGTYSYGHTAFTLGTTYATAFDITTLFNYGLGYVFQDGDYVRIYNLDGTNTLLPLIGGDGNFIFAKPTEIGTLGAVSTFIEVYTPYRPSVSEPLYETGDMIAIDNPTTSSRQYSITAGTINGDCYAIEREKSGGVLYFVEAMSPNDKVWTIWQQDRGWTTGIDTIGQQQKETSIDWSDTYINGTKSNGFNKFGALNTKDIGNTSGAITKIQLTNKQQEDGTVMLVVTETDHLSAYLQEVQLVASATNDALVQTDQVIGTINALKNGKGSINPETVEEYNGVVWGLSILQGVAWQYANDGVTDISDYKMNQFFNRYAKRYIANGYTSAYQPIPSCYDPSTDEMMWVLPSVESVYFQTNLPSYDNVTPSYASSIKNRFNFYDGQAKILVFKPLKNQWVGSYQWLPEGMMNFANKLFLFKAGVLWLGNENFTSFNNIFGVQYPQRVCLPINVGDPSAIKDLMDIALEINGKVPNYTVVYSTYPYEQITDLTADDFEAKEGVEYASFMKDRLSPNIIGSAIQKLLEGDIINSASPLLMIEWQIYDSQLVLNFINIGTQLSRGQMNLLNQK